MLRVGVIADEFFDLQLGRMGGFGWAARQLSRIFNSDPTLGVEVTYLSGELAATPRMSETKVHGARLLLRRAGRWSNARMVRRENFDLLLTIDYNRAYSVFLRAMPRTPAIIWVRDPWSPDDIEKIDTLRIPGAENEKPQGRHSYDGRSVARIAHESAWLGRKLMFATPAPHLVSRLRSTYGLEPWDFYCLPNPILLEPTECIKSEQPTVVFLARLDPIKRPWLFVELARRFPRVEFLFLGQSHVTGPGSWQPVNLPENVRLLGHVDEAEKVRLLSAAWVAINTAIHEGLAVSFLEALSCETPLLCGQNPGFVVSRYGIYAGRSDGSGMEALDAFSAGLRMLLENRELRESLGRAGRNWVRTVHTRENFLEAFFRLCRFAGVER